jgi:hypothetical protein
MVNHQGKTSVEKEEQMVLNVASTHIDHFATMCAFVNKAVKDKNSITAHPGKTQYKDKDAIKKHNRSEGRGNGD